MISTDEMIGYSKHPKCGLIHKIFLDSYKSPLSLIFINGIDHIIDYVHIVPHFSNLVLQTLLILLKKISPDDERKLLIIVTTSVPHLMEDLRLVQTFGVLQSVNPLQEKGEIADVLRLARHVSHGDAGDIAALITKPIGIKYLFMVAEMSRQALSSDGLVEFISFLESLHTVGY